MQDDLISIIIPVYNVEKYITDCLNSVVNQSYTNIEVIIVNDGSTDGSSTICELFSDKYENVKVFNQKNKGLSAARNIGIEHSNGEYITFLDSDDYISTDYCSTLHKAVKNTKALQAMCCMVRIDEGGEILRDNSVSVSGDFTVLSTEEFFSLICSNKKSLYYTSACGKIFHKSLFTNCINRFPLNVLFEDNWLSIKLFLETKKICLVNVELYYYRKRQGSITNTVIQDPEYILDFCEQLNDTINVVFGSNEISQDIKIRFCKDLTNRIGFIQTEYLYAVYKSQILCGTFISDQRFALFGAGDIGQRFRKNVLSSIAVDKIVYVDNDYRKQGLILEGSLVISIDDYMENYRTHRLLVTMIYLFECIAQLKNLNVINNESILLPYKGGTVYEKALLKGIRCIMGSLVEVGAVL